MLEPQNNQCVQLLYQWYYIVITVTLQFDTTYTITILENM